MTVPRPLTNDMSRGQLLAIPFQQIDIEGTQADIVLGIDDDLLLDAPVPFAGEILGVAVHLSVARTAGTLTFQPRINGADDGPALKIDADNTQNNHVVASRGQHPFKAGDRVGITLTAAGFTPTTADLRGTLVVGVRVEGI